jgi:hypothetical protein
MKTLFIVPLILFIFAGCSKSNNSNPPAVHAQNQQIVPAPPPSPSPNPPSPPVFSGPQAPPVAMTDPDAAQAKQAQADAEAKAQQDALDAQAAQAKELQKETDAKAAQLQKELDAAKQYELNAATPEQRASAALLQGKPIVFLYRVWSQSEDNLNLFRNKLRSVDITQSVDNHFKINFNTKQQWVGRYLAALNSNVAFKEVGDYLKALQMGWISPQPVEKAFVRTKMTVWFNSTSKEWTKISPKSETFFVGDSQPFPLTAEMLAASKDSSADVSLLTSDFNSCRDITPECLESLRTQPFLFQTIEIGGTTARPWDWLRGKLSDSMNIINAHKTTFDATITNISLSHWLFIAGGEQSTGYDPKTIFTLFYPKTDIVDDNGSMEAPFNINSTGLANYVMEQPYRLATRLNDLLTYMTNTPAQLRTP